MSSINSITHIQSYGMFTASSKILSEATIQRLLALGIDPTTVQSETEAQILIAQAEAAKNHNNNPEQEGGKQQDKHKAELIQQNIYNTMDMISINNKLILGL